MSKKDEILDHYKGFAPVSLSHGRRDPKSRSVDYIKTLALSSRGRLTIPSKVWDHYKFDGQFFLVRCNKETKELLIMFLKNNDPEAKTIGGISTTTKSCEIGPQLRAFKINFDKIAAVSFVVMEKNVMILNFNEAIKRK